MESDQENKKQRKHQNSEPQEAGQDVNNIGTVGFISYSKKEGKGSFKNIGKLADKKPNIEGIGENEENHATKL